MRYMKPMLFCLLVLIVGCRSNKENQTAKSAKKDSVGLYHSVFGLLSLSEPIRDTIIQFPLQGEYLIKQRYSLPGVLTELDSESADYFVGRKFFYINNRIISEGDTCLIDSMEVEQFTDEQYQNCTRGSGTAPVSFADLQYHGQNKIVTAYLLNISTEYFPFGRSVLYFDSSHIVVEYKGYDYEVIKSAP